MELHFLKVETKRSKPWVQQLPPQRLPDFLGSLPNFSPYLPGKEEGSWSTLVPASSGDP